MTKPAQQTDFELMQNVLDQVLNIQSRVCVLILLHKQLKQKRPDYIWIMLMFCSANGCEVAVLTIINQKQIQDTYRKKFCPAKGG